MSSFSLTNMFFLVYLIFVVKSVSSDIVPVYMWETQKSSETVPALGRISSETFKEVINSRLENNPRIVIFTESNMSPEDFIGHDKSGRNTFQHLSELESTTRVSYLPYVEDPIEVLTQLADQEVTRVSVNDFIDHPSIPKSGILIIDLNDAKDNEDRNDMLRRHDETVFSIYKKLLKEDDNILSLFTAIHSSWIIPEEVMNSRQNRHILADPTEPTPVPETIHYDTDRTMFFLNSTAIYSNNGNVKQLLNKTEYTATYTNESRIMKLMFESKSDKLTMFFNNGTNGYWVWYNLTLESGTTTSTFSTKNISAPRGFSYHCSQQTFYVKGNKNENITFPGLQFQPFFEQEVNISSTGFGDAYDCVGFTSAPIWSGLFVTFILAFIMTMGLTMMMDIKTMDRFDDPKGKTIIINAAE